VKDGLITLTLPLRKVNGHKKKNRLFMKLKDVLEIVGAKYLNFFLEEPKMPLRIVGIVVQ
jgi:hypothetical protein